MPVPSKIFVRCRGSKQQRRCYATIYQVVIEDCQKHGQFDPAKTPGTLF
jgi:monomeric isocitrate dehydrogenase